MKLFSCFVLAAIAGLSVGPIRSAPLNASFSLAAQEGQQAPELSPGVVFVSFGPPVVNAAGDIAFVAGLEGTDVTLDNDIAIFAGAPGALELVARAGAPAPGLGAGVAIGQIGEIVQFDDLGRVYFTSSVGGLGVTLANDGVLWVGDGNSLTKVAREGDPVPGGVGNYRDGTFFSTTPVGPPMVGEQGLVFSGGEGLSTTNDDILIAGQADELTLLAREGSSAPGAADAIYMSTNPLTPGSTFGLGGIASDGRVAFRSTIAGPGVDDSNNGGIWSGTPGRVRLRVREGELAPGLPTKPLFHAFSGAPGLSSGGALAFLALLRDSEGDLLSPAASMWTDAGGSLRLVVKPGQRAPGTTGGTTFTAFSSPLIDRLGRLQFYAFLEGKGVTAANDVALFGGPRGKVRLLAREGTQAPGLAAGVKIGDLNVSDTMLGPRTVLLAPLLGEGVTPQNDEAIFATDNAGRLQPLVRTGEMVDLGNQGSHVLTTVRFPGVLTYGDSILRPGGGTDGRLRVMNDLGRLVLLATFLELGNGVMLCNVPPGGTILTDIQVESVEDGGWTAQDIYRKLPTNRVITDTILALEPGDSDTVRFRIQNDGRAMDSFRLRSVVSLTGGRRGESPVSVRFFKGDGVTEITDALKAGTYTEADIPPGEYREYVVLIETSFRTEEWIDDQIVILQGKSLSDGKQRDDARLGVAIRDDGEF